LDSDVRADLVDAERKRRVRHGLGCERAGDAERLTGAEYDQLAFARRRETGHAAESRDIYEVVLRWVIPVRASGEELVAVDYGATRIR
jgi:hypothetical protein